MCGIVGVISTSRVGLHFDDIKAFNDMLFMDTLRGEDGTGVFSVKMDGDADFYKRGIPGSDFVKDPTYKQILQDARREAHILIGHNRHATIGSISDENAHPFVVDNKIILVQNGTYFGDHTKLYNTEVDTEAIAHHLAKEKNIEKALNDVDAAFALVWYSLEEESLYIIRNYHRPLYMATSAHGAVFLSSEAGILWAATKRNKIYLEKPPKEIEEDTLITFKKINGVYTETSKKLNLDNVFGYSSHKYSKYEYDPKKNQPTPKDIDTTFPLVAMMDIPDAVMPYVEAQKEYEKEKVLGRRDIYVSIKDYVKCNNHPECSSFIVYGKSMMEDTNTYIYWLELNTTEKNVIDKVYEEYYKVTLSVPQIHTFEKEAEKYGVVISYASSPVKANVYA